MLCFAPFEYMHASQIVFICIAKLIRKQTFETEGCLAQLDLSLEWVGRLSSLLELSWDWLKASSS